MNREGAETYLRLLGEAELREPLAPEVRQPWSGARSGGMARMMAVATALTAVGAIDTEIAEEILADFDLAVSVRRAGRPQAGQGVWPAGPAWAAAVRGGQADGPGGAAGLAGQEHARRRAATRRCAGRWAAAGAAKGGRRRGRTAGLVPAVGVLMSSAGGAERFVAVGVTVPFEHGELYLISYAHTGSGARFTVVWRMRDPHSPARPGHARMPPFEKLSATDDRGGRYRLQFAGRDSPEWTGRLSLHPEPPDDIRWIDICVARRRRDPGQPGPGRAGRRHARGPRGDGRARASTC